MACRVSRRRDRWDQVVDKSPMLPAGRGCLGFAAPCWGLGLGSWVEDRGSRLRREGRDETMQWDAIQRLDLRGGGVAERAGRSQERVVWDTLV